MTAYAVKTAGDWDAPAAVCAETTDAGDGAGSETPDEGGETVTQAMDLSSDDFTITLKEEDYTYTGSAITQEIPVGIITAACGGPFFLYLLRKSRKGGAVQ